MAQPLDEHGSPQRWIFFFLVFGLIGITILFIISRVFQYSGPALVNSPYSTDKRLLAFELGDTRFYIPENTIRHPEQRNGQRVNKLDLIMLWPGLDGFDLDNQVAFYDVSEKSKLIFVSLSHQDEVLSSSDRLYAVYSQYFVGEPIKAEGGLIGFAMAPQSSFAGERIYFKPDDHNPFAARCITPVEKSPTFCLRDLKLNDTTQLTYRFRRPLLAEWRALDAKIKQRVSAFIRK